MKIKDILSLGAKGISERKFRTALTVLSVVIGVAAIVALISLVTGISVSISKSLESVGPSAIYLVPTGTHIFTDADIAELESLPNISTAIPLIRFSANLTENGQSQSVSVIGVNNYSLPEALGSVNLFAGSVYQDSNLPFAVVGYDIAFPTTTQSVSSVPLNQSLYLTASIERGSTKSITVIPVGILNAYGSALFISPDTSVFIPLTEAESITGKYSYNIILVEAKNATAVTSVYNLLENVYGNEASILSVQSLAATVASITGSIAVLLGSIAGISLIVAGISILSIMMVSVTERTREIGILKAIGFKKRDVMVLFLSEALIIGLLGGFAGVAVGGAGAYVLTGLLSSKGTTSTPSLGSAAPAGAGGGAFFVSGAAGSGRSGSFSSASRSSLSASSSSSSAASTTSFTPVITPAVVIIAVAIAVIVSLLSSLYPAWKAASIDPVKAIRSE